MEKEIRYTDAVIEWKDGGGREHVTFADRAAEDDSQVFYTGLDRSRLLGLVGRDFGEDFIVVGVD